MSSSKSIKTWIGPSLVAFAAFLWATDALIRYPSISRLDPTFIVWFEHVLGVILLLPWILWKNKNEIFSLSFKSWVSALFSGVGGSAIATVFFTASFIYVNPSVSVLLQKLQPVLVVLIAYPILGERPERKFYIWGFVALLAGIVLSFPDLNFDFLSSGVDLHSKGIQYAFGAALLWAASTVSGKTLLQETSPTLATFWRFFFGLVALSLIMVVAGNLPDTSVLQSKETLFVLFYLSLIPGIFAMLIYYRGLSRTPASVSTFIELVYPIGAVILNTAFLHTPLVPIQIIAGLILTFAVAMISF